MNYSSAFNIEDLRQLAQRRLPRVAWDYLERGAEDDATMAANRAAFERIQFEPRTLVDVSACTLRHTLFGKIHAAPFGIAPTGAAGLYSFEADIALARAAAKAGVPFVLSTAGCARGRRQQMVPALHVQGSRSRGTPGAPRF